MNFNYKELLPAGFADSSRVWVYQSSRLFSVAEVLQIESLLNEFVSEWKSHGEAVKGFGTIFFGQFIVLMADDSESRICGRSTDESARMIHQIEQLFKASFFDRLSLAFVIKGKVQLLPLAQFSHAFDNNFIDEQTIYFNNAVSTKQELENNWLVPVGKSWLAKKITPAIKQIS
ncbi:MAG: hypothetical protein JST47_08910 [Bacteroidetes bacterium]|nr:hypothetical protein [Bacteroidota bacterium]MBS1974468.1 hypothetical protein [Bacteroidota bacterium]